MRSVGVVLILLSLMMSSCLMKGINSYDSRNERYYFHDDSTFNWTGHGGKGEGTVKVIKDSIKLTFSEVKRLFEVQLNEEVPNSSGDSHIEIRAIKSSGEPFAGLLITLAYSKIQTETNRLGIAKIDIKDAVLKDILSVYLHELDREYLDINLRGYDRLVAVVVDNETGYQKNQTVTYHFRKRGKYMYLNGVRFRKYLPLM